MKILQRNGIVNKVTKILISIAIPGVATMAFADPLALKTHTGNDIGLSISSYKYQEPGIMSLTGTKLGLDLHVVRVSEERENLIFRGDLRYAFGLVDYNSSGTGSSSGEPDWYIEARALFGKDWEINNAVLSPYTGLGYRYLFNDGRGITSTGNSGYRRESNYFYLPLGVIHRTAFDNRARLESRLEYDQLLSGTQNTHLSDVGWGYSDVTNDQSSGYGLKLSVKYLKDKWAIGPYLDYWNIADSNIVVVYRFGVPDSLGLEPKNNTVEFGLKASQQF